MIQRTFVVILNEDTRFSEEVPITADDLEFNLDNLGYDVADVQDRTGDRSL